MNFSLELSTSPDHSGIVHVVTTDSLIQGVKNNEYMRILKAVLHNSIINTQDGAICEWHASMDIVNHFNYIVPYMKKLGFDYMILWFEGNKLDHGIEDALLEWSRYRSTDWTLMGHILDRDGRSPVFHEQCVVFNLNNIEEDTDLNYYNEDNGRFVASKEHVHDDYTPLWVKSAPGLVDKKVEPRSIVDHVMWNLLSQGHTVVNVPNTIRKRKECAYAEEDEEQTIEWLLSDKISEMSLQEGYELCGRIGEDKSILAESLMQRDVVYVTNTDNMDINFKPNVDTIVCPASGLNQFMYAVQNIETLKRMVWTDFSPIAIWWTKYILEHWNGRDFRDFWFEHQDKLEAQSNEPELIEVNDKKLDWLNDYFNGLDESIWTTILNLEHVFLQIDLVNDYNKVLDIVKDEDVFLQATNIYLYEANYVFNKYHRVFESFYTFLNKLVEANKNVYFIGDTPNGKRYRYTPINLSRVAKI